MNRMRAPFVGKIVPISVIALLLFCTPLHLAAQEKEPRDTANQASVTAWLSGLWSNLTAWLADEVPPPGPEQPPENLDGACSIDPWGICRDNGS